MHHSSSRHTAPPSYTRSPLNAEAARRLREELGMTYADVAYGMSVAYGMRMSAHTVAAWEQGAGAPDESQLTALAGALWCAPGDLLSSPTTLREHRMARGMPVSDLARALGMDPAAYERIEADGKWTGSERQTAVLTRLLDLSPETALKLTGKADKLADLLRSAVTSRWQPYARPVRKLVPLEREETEAVLLALHDAYQSTTAASLSWAGDSSSADAGAAGRDFLDAILDHFWHHAHRLSGTRG